MKVDHPTKNDCWVCQDTSTQYIAGQYSIVPNEKLNICIVLTESRTRDEIKGETHRGEQETSPHYYYLLDTGA